MAESEAQWAVWWHKGDGRGVDDEAMSAGPYNSEARALKQANLLARHDDVHAIRVVRRVWGPWQVERSLDDSKRGSTP